MRPAQLLAASVLAPLLLAACAARPLPPPGTAVSPPSQTAEPAAAEPPPPVDFSAIPPAPAACDAFVAHAPGTCAAPDEGRTALAAALTNDDALARDAALAALGSCPAFPSGVIAALRAELAPPECGDAILRGGEASLPDGGLRDAITGLAIAAQLDRLVDRAPELEPPFDKPRFETFLRETLARWVSGQAKAIQQLSERGAALAGYGKGIVAIHAGLADMRFVAAARAVPLPTDLAGDEELKDAYYGSLDQALEPRKARGRDAALVGLRLMAEVGSLSEPRIQRARALLSEMYAGRRIDALDRLRLPDPTGAPSVSTDATLAARLPTFYLARLVPKLDATDPGVLRALADRGLPAPLRAQLDATSLRPEARLLYGLALVRSGQCYWRAADFQQAARLLAPISNGGAQSAAARLLAAVSETLANGAKDAVEMMSRGPFPGARPDVSALDRLARGRGELAARAGLDAALLLGLSPPEQNARAFFQDLERRYRDAASRAEQDATRRDALAQAAAAADTAAAIPE